MVKFLDLKSVNECFRAELDAAAQRVLDSGWYLLGKECESFEKEFADWCGVKHCIGCANGLDALKLIIQAYGIGPGDELQRHLSGHGIQTVIHYPIPPHRQPAYTEWHGLSLPVTERIHDTILSLPMSPVMSEEEVSAVVRAVNEWKGE